MSDRPIWRLGTVEAAGGPSTVLESGGELYPLGEFLRADRIASPQREASVLEILQAWDAWQPVLDAAAQRHVPLEPLERDAVSWLPPVPDPPKFICAGANYHDHLAEMGVQNPRMDNPFAFVKPVNTLLGHERPLAIPPKAKKIDWEGEVAIVIGRRAKDVTGQGAMDAVAGYCMHNDVSARDWVHKPVPGVGMDFILHKSFDGFAPIGPLLTPAAFVGDPQNLSIELSVNGVLKQDSSTAQMIFGVEQIIEHLASVMTLEPGDIISTGSPAGVGHGRGEYLQPGDTVSLRVTGLGELTTPFVGS